MSAPRIVPYDECWPRIAEHLLAEIAEAVRLLPGSESFAYDHIGSTAVPGLSAKPIIDLQLLVPTLPLEPVLATALAPLGLQMSRGARSDSPGVRADIPRPGTDTDPAKHAKLLFHRPGSVPDLEVILHVRRSDSPFAHFVIRFRDWLRQDRHHAARYERLKLDLASRFAHAEDYDDYTRAKGVFLDDAQRAMGRPVR